MAFVVRLKLDDRTDNKVFERKPDAQARFHGAWIKLRDYEDAKAMLYEVQQTSDAREAVAAVDAGNAELVEILPRPLSQDESDSVDAILEEMLAKLEPNPNADRT